MLAGVMRQSEGWATRCQHVAVAPTCHLVSSTWLLLPPLLLSCLLLQQLRLPPHLALASESPDRECCDFQYPYLPPPPLDTGTTPAHPEDPFGGFVDYYTTPYTPARGGGSGDTYIDVTAEQQEISTTQRSRRPPPRTRRPDNGQKRRTTTRKTTKKKKDKATTPRWYPGLSISS